ncbi:MAG: 2-dehydropantoate 2-reductase, partial [Proteobacteria bacterium]|nr:2-dehydropantoate 2-reductase [Pseudomonadota bacterium]
GCFLGGRLAASGVDVRFVGRPSMREDVMKHGLRLSDFHGRSDELPPAKLNFSTDGKALADCDLILVTVKSTATEEAARSLASVIGPDTLVFSFQNGVRNAAILQSHLPKTSVLAAMVPFNVLNLGQGKFHLGTSGALILEAHGDSHKALAQALTRAGFSVKLRKDITRVQWGKLLINLNNAVNALAGVPLYEEFCDRGYRLILAALIREGLASMDAAGIRPASAAGVPVRLVPLILSLPNPIFFRIARTMLTIDPKARSSMWEDLERRRPTEIDILSGEITSLAERCGLAAPVNQAIAKLIHEADRAALGSPRLSSAQLSAQLGLKL